MSSTNSAYSPTPISFASVPIQQIIENNRRLDASAYDMAVLKAKSLIIKNRYGFKYLRGEGGLIQKAYYPGRYKRIYCDYGKGVPFYLPSQLDEIYPKPSKYISEKTASLLKNDVIKSGELLVSRSGTIGKCAVASKTTIGNLFSDDVIRITFNEEYDLGYVYAFLHTETGLTLLQGNNYGAVIDHIEPEHLNHVIIPDAPVEIRKRIHKLVMESFALRDESNELIDKAQTLMYSEFHLSQSEERVKHKASSEHVGLLHFSIKSSSLDGRFDVSYHLPEVSEVLEKIKKNASKVLFLDDEQLTDRIYVGNRFKRVYVTSKNGVIYLNGKSILQLNPNGCQKKYLSFSQHEQRIKEQLTLKENTIIVTCSGTLGKTVLVPRHWDGWAGTHDLIRIIPHNDLIAGYLYCFLSSDIGQRLILRNAYGAVVDHIEPEHIQRIPIPLLKNKDKQIEINNLVLEANELRYQAYLKENEALAEMEKVLKH